MNVKFWPSLQLIVMVRIAQEIVHILGINLNKVKHQDYSYNPEGGVRLETFFNIFSIPRRLVLKLYGIAKTLCLEIKNWYLSHKDIVLSTDIDLSNEIRWYSYGIIDRFGTAKILIQNENISMVLRFFLACKYFFDDHVHTLWDNLPKLSKLYVVRQRSLASNRFWINHVNARETTDSTLMFRGATGTEYFNENYLGIRHYFKELTPEAKYQCISYGLREGNIHHFDLYLCFSEMNIDEVKNLIHRLSATNRLNMMECFLSWPLQCIFGKMLDQIWDFIPRYCFRNIFHFILRKRVEENWYDIDYVQLVKEIWTLSPLSYKNSLKRDRIYEEVLLLWVYETYRH